MFQPTLLVGLEYQTQGAAPACVQQCSSFLHSHSQTRPLQAGPTFHLNIHTAQ